MGFFVIALLVGFAIGNSVFTGFVIWKWWPLQKTQVSSKIPMKQKILQNFCNDSDGGVNFFVGGTCIDSNGIKFDSCNGTALTEWFCGGQNSSVPHCVAVVQNCADLNGSRICYNNRCSFNWTIIVNQNWTASLQRLVAPIGNRSQENKSN